MKNSFMLILLFILFPVILFAEDFDIEKYDVSIDMKKDSMIEVSEEITVNFYKLKHGIFRFIPIIYKNDEIGKETFLDIFDVKVFKKDGNQNLEWQQEDFNLTHEKQNLFIKIGKKDFLVDGVQQYLIKYKVYNAVDKLQDKDVFSWNIIGTDWPVKIKKVNFNLQFPSNVFPKKDSVKIYIGRLFGKEDLKNFDYGMRQISFNFLSGLEANEGITIFLDFDKNLFSEIPLSRKIRMFFTSYFKLIFLSLCYCVCVILWYLYGKDDYVATPVEFYPPKDMDPVKFGFLLNDSLENSEIFSLIFYWATKGYIKIIDKNNDENSTSLVKIKSLSDTAPEYQKTLFNKIFLSSDDVMLKNLDHKLFNEARKLRDQAEKDFFSNDFYTKSSIRIKKFLPIFIVIIYICFFVLTSIGLGQNEILYLQGMGYVFTLRFFEILLPLFFFFIFKTILKKTSNGNKVYAQVQGFKNFINSVEKPQIEVLMRKEPDYFNKALPYAVALGISNKFVEKFEGILKEAPTWYEGNSRVFSLNKFNNNIQNNISSANHIFQSVSSRSSIGGGSFSGGGHGGGGGGSW